MFTHGRGGSSSPAGEVCGIYISENPWLWPWPFAERRVLWPPSGVVMAESVESMDTVVAASEIAPGAPPLAMIAWPLRGTGPDMPCLGDRGQCLQRFAERGGWQGCCLGAGGRLSAALSRGILTHLSHLPSLHGRNHQSAAHSEPPHSVAYGTHAWQGTGRRKRAGPSDECGGWRGGLEAWRRREFAAEGGQEGRLRRRQH